MMRIALVLEATTGGTARHVVDLSAELIRGGNSLTLIYSPIRADSRFEAEIASLAFEHVERLPMRRAVGPWDIKTAVALRKIIDRLGPFDVIHGHSSKAGALARLVTPRGTARVYTPHAFRTMDPELKPWLEWMYGGAERILATLTDCALVGSDQELKEAVRLGLQADAVRRVAFGLEDGPQVSRSKARSLIGLDDDDIVVGFVGRVTHQKAPERVIEAIAASRHRKLRLVIAGDGDQTAAIGALIRERGLEDRVKMLGWVDGRAVMPAFDLLMVPSRYESLGYVYIEALAARVPVLASPTGLAPGLYADGRLGRLVRDTNDLSAWKAALDVCVDELEAFEVREGDRTAFSISAMGRDVMEAYEAAYCWAARS